MKMQYQQLTEYLLRHLPKDYQANFYSWIQQGEITNQGRAITANGLMLAAIETECIFWFEALPFRQIDPVQIMALIEIWLNENTPCEGYIEQNERLPFDLTLIDDNTADLQFTLKFTDPIYLEKDENGEVSFNGETYRIDSVSIYYAENVSVEAKIRHKNRWKQD